MPRNFILGLITFGAVALVARLVGSWVVSTMVDHAHGDAEALRRAGGMKDVFWGGSILLGMIAGAIVLRLTRSSRPTGPSQPG